MEDALTDFLHYCRVERRLAPLTCSAYERDVSACLRFLQAEGVRAWAVVRPADVRRFLADEAGRRPAPSSQARTIAALKGFFRFLVESEAIQLNPATDAEMMFDTRWVRREKPIRAICATTFPDPAHRSPVMRASSAGSPGLVYLGAAGQVLDTVSLITAPLTTSGFATLEQAVTIPAGWRRCASS